MKKIITLSLAIIAGIVAMTAQNSVPAPGADSITPSASGGFRLPPAPAAWGSPWGYGWGNLGYEPSVTVVSTPTWQQSGKTNVIATGYDDEGVCRTVPMSVEYNYDGSEYSVIVLTAWNPWTDNWNTNLNIPAQNTSYRLDGKDYHFYAVLSTGTYYFNL